MFCPRVSCSWWRQLKRRREGPESFRPVDRSRARLGVTSLQLLAWAHDIRAVLYAILVAITDGTTLCHNTVRITQIILTLTRFLALFIRSIGTRRRWCTPRTSELWNSRREQSATFRTRSSAGCVSGLRWHALQSNHCAVPANRNLLKLHRCKATCPTRQASS